MDINNLAIIFAPNLLWDSSSDQISADDNFRAADFVKFIFVNYKDILK